MAILISDFMKSKMFLFRGWVSRFLSYIIWSRANYVYTVYTKSMDKRNTINNIYTFIIKQQPWDNGSYVYKSDTIITISLSHAILRQRNIMFHEISNTMVSLMSNFLSTMLQKVIHLPCQYFRRYQAC